MSTVLSMMTRVRRKIRDVDAVGFEPDEVIDALNDGARLLRRQIAVEFPWFIAEDPETGNTAEGTNSITLSTLLSGKKPLAVVEVRVDNSIVNEYKRDAIDDLTQTGKPAGYYLLGIDTKLYWWPKPNGAYAYEMVIVAEGDDMAQTDTDSGWPTEIEDAIVEFASARLPMRNNYSTADEMALANNMIDQVRQIIWNKGQAALGVKSYW